MALVPPLISVCICQYQYVYIVVSVPIRPIVTRVLLTIPSLDKATVTANSYRFASRPLLLTIRSIPLPTYSSV